MKHFALAAAILGPAAVSSAQWWWPPQDPIVVNPPCPSPGAPVEIEIGGVWHNGCKPNEGAVVVSGFDVDFNIERTPPPTFCLAVLTPWSLTRGSSPLPAGTYTVYTTYFEGGSVVHPRVQVGSFVVGGVCDCYADCNGDGALNLADFGCFQTKFAIGDPYADCNGDGVRNLSDFGCYQTKFALGCP